MPQNIQDEWGSDNPTAYYCYIDTVALFFRRKPRGLARIKALQSDRLVKRNKSHDRKGNLCGYLLFVQKPCPEAIMLLDTMQTEQGGTLVRFDIAFDTICERPNDRKERLVRHVVMLRRPPGHMHDIEQTTYLTFWLGRSDNGQRPVRRDLVIYADRECKITGEVDCVHAELRFQGADSVRRAGFGRIGDLMTCNPRVLFAKNIRLANFDMEGFIQSAVKRHIKKDRERYRDRPFSAFLDNYRANAPRRVRSIIERATQMRVQRFRDLLKVKVEWVSLDVLNIPETLTFDDNHKHHTPSSKYPSDINDTTMLTDDRSLSRSQKQTHEGVMPKLTKTTL